MRKSLSKLKLIIVAAVMAGCVNNGYFSEIELEKKTWKIGYEMNQLPREVRKKLRAEQVKIADKGKGDLSDSRRFKSKPSRELLKFYMNSDSTVVGLIYDQGGWGVNTRIAFFEINKGSVEASTFHFKNGVDISNDEVMINCVLGKKCIEETTDGW